MWTESEIQNFKNIFLDETLCYGHQDEAEKVFDESFEKVRNLDFQDKEELIDKLFETLETPAEFVAFFKGKLAKYNLVNGASPEECFRNGVLIGKEFFLIEEKQH